MLGRFDLLVFDWDGTLSDSTTVIAEAIQRAAADLLLPIPDFATASHVIGLGLTDALRTAVPTLPTKDIPGFVTRYRAHYAAGEANLALFDGVLPLLKALAEHKTHLAVATGKSREGLDRAMARSGLAQRFSASRCADEAKPKPHPAMLLDPLDHFGVRAARTLMIGDTVHDLDMAAAAGTAAVGLSQGAHPMSELKTRQPLALFETLPQFQRWLIPT